jgi:hypothetical protein
VTSNATKIKAYKAMSAEDRMRADYAESVAMQIEQSEPEIEIGPKIDKREREAGEGLPDRLPDYVEVAGWRVEVEEDDDYLHPLSLHAAWVMEEPWRILILSDLPIEQKWYLFFHELVHGYNDLVSMRLMKGHIEVPSW